MKTLELKDICGYLPYGLVFQDKGRGVYLQLVNLLSAQKLIDKSHDYTEVGPVLRPMSDLTKEITHRGEKFVPLYKLTPAFKYFQWSDDRFRLEITQDCVVIGVYSKSLGDWGGHARIDLTTSKLDKLDAWMFDYRGLISAGLAIDVNTLPKNPYEK